MAKNKSWNSGGRENSGTSAEREWVSSLSEVFRDEDMDLLAMRNLRRSVRMHLSLWFSSHVALLVDRLKDSSGFLKETKDISAPREVRRAIVRSVKSSETERFRLCKLLETREAAFVKRLSEEEVSAAKDASISKTVESILVEIDLLSQLNPSFEFHFEDFRAQMLDVAISLNFLQSPDSKSLSKLVGIDVAKATTNHTEADRVVDGVKNQVASLVALFCINYRDLLDTSKKHEKLIASLKPQAEMVPRHEKEANRLTKSNAELKAKLERAETERISMSSRNGELRWRITELEAEVKSGLSKIAALESALSVKPVDREEADAVLYELSESLEFENRRLIEEAAINARIVSDQAAKILSLEKSISELREEASSVRESHSFLARIERDPSKSSPDDLLRYAALTDLPIVEKERAVAAIVAFFDRFLTATTKGASSSTNPNSSDAGTAGGKYSNNLVNPVFNFLKQKAKNLHSQRFLDEMCRVEWGALLDEYSGGEAVEMGNKKQRVVTGARNLFRENSRALPLFRAIGYLADKLSEYEVGDIDLGRLSGNMREAVAIDPVGRFLKESLFENASPRPSAQNR